MSTDIFFKHFSSIKDPRQSAKVSYPLFDIIFLTVTAVIAGCEGWEEIEDFGEARLDWFKTFGYFDNGIPVHDTIARLISRISGDQFQSCFSKWMQDVSKCNNDIVAIDGKTLRGSYNRDDRLSTIHMVSAFATGNGVVMGQYKTNEKSNEITAIPELLSLLELNGCLVTLDAMGCQTDIAQAIVDKDADYVLAVKGNQGNLHQAIQKAFSQRLATTEHDNVTIEKHHGRIECREYHVLDASELDGDFTRWPKLTTIGVAMSYRQVKGKQASLEYRYYISSATLGITRFSESVRRHWDVENKLHWVLDVTMNEDACQIYRGHAAENLACIRHTALNMLRKETTKKVSIARKRRLAAMTTDYLEKVLAA